MIGIIQRTLLQAVRLHGGPDAAARVAAAAGAPGREFRIDRDYPDDECLRLIAAACDVLGLSEREVYAAFSEHFLDEAQRMFPRFFEMSASSHDLLRRQPAIHASLASGLRSDDGDRLAAARKFVISVGGPERIVVDYRSPNRLCRLYCALAEAAAARCGDRIRIREPACMHDGADGCRIEIDWLSFGRGFAGRAA